MAKTKFTLQEELFLQLLKELRRDRSLTQKSLADRLGFPQSYVSKYETGERRLDFVETANICEPLGLTIQQFAKLFIDKVRKATQAKNAKTD